MNSTPYFQQLIRRVLNFKETLASRHVANNGKFKLGDWWVEPALDRISQGELRVSLQPQVMDLLVYLAQHRNEVVSSEELLAHVWEGRVVTSASIYSGLKQLRDALGDDVHAPSYIKTVPKRGYRLVAEVVFPEAEAAVRTTHGTNILPGSPYARPRWRLAAYFLLGLMAVIVMLLAPWTGAERTLPSQLSQADRSLAVLPFTDMSPAQDQGWFCDGIAEEILNKLAQVPGLKVSGRMSSFAFREPDAELSTVADTLGVRHLLEGSVRREGDRMRVTAQLLDARDGFHIWSKQYDREVGDIFQVQDDIAGHIATALQLQLAPARTGANAAALSYYPDFTAYELYLQARELIRAHTGESLQGALVKLNKALQLEPDFAAAHVAMAETYGLLYQSLTFYEGDRVEESRALMRPHVEKALALDPNLAEAYVQQAWFLDTDEETDAALRKAIALNPNLASAYRELGIGMANGWHPWNDALAYLDKALELEPLSLENATVLAKFLSFVPHRRDDALQIIENLKRSHPDHPNIAMLEGEWLLGQGRLAAAVPLLEKSVLGDPDNSQARGLLSITWFALGETGRALETPYWQRQWRLVLAPDREDSLAQLAAMDYSGPMDFSYRALTAYVYLMLHEAQSAIETLLDYSQDLELFRTDCAMMCGKRYSPALTLATAYKSTGDEERFQQFAALDREASEIRWDHGRIHNFEFSRTMARLNALEGRPYEALLELERLVSSGPVDPRELMHPAFDEFRDDPRFVKLQGLQRERVNTERRALGLAPLSGTPQTSLAQSSK